MESKKSLKSIKIKQQQGKTEAHGEAPQPEGFAKSLL